MKYVKNLHLQTNLIKCFLGLMAGRNGGSTISKVNELIFNNINYDACKPKITVSMKKMLVLQ